MTNSAWGFLGGSTAKQRAGDTEGARLFLSAAQPTDQGEESVVLLVVVGAGTIFHLLMYIFWGCEKAKTLSQKGCEKAKTLSLKGFEKTKTFLPKGCEKAKTLCIMAP